MIDAPASGGQADDALLAGTLDELDTYSYAHPDVIARDGGANGDTLWELLTLVRTQPGFVAGLGSFTVRNLIERGVLGAQKAALVRYAKAVGGDDNTTVLAPVDNLDRALQFGNALSKIDTVVPGYVQHDVIKQGSIFGDCATILVDTPGLLDAFVKYMGVVKPALTSMDGADIGAFSRFFTETGGDVTRYVGRLKYIRAHHHFKVSSLEVLVANEADRTRRRPLTVVLHTASDWNGGFDRANPMAALIENRGNLVIVIEGSASLAAAGDRLAEVAATYGQHGKADQILLAGHGSNRSMEMAAKQDASTTTYEDLDLDKNAANTDAFLRRVLATMSPDSPHRRIVLDACLTNADGLPDGAGSKLSKDASTGRQQVNQLLHQNESLAQHLRDLAQQSHTNVSVSGADASNIPTSFTDLWGGGLKVSSSADPALVAEKMTYLTCGTEPEGALRALLSCWAHDPKAARAAVEKRAGVSFMSGVLGWAGLESLWAALEWDEAIIHVCYLRALQHWDDPAVIARLPDTAGALAELQWDQSISLEACASLIAPEDRLGTVAPLAWNASWLLRKYIQVIGLQLLVGHDASAATKLLSLIASNYDARRLVPYAGKDDALLGQVLRSGAGPLAGQVMLAIVHFKEFGSAVAKQFLLQLRQGGQFPATLKLETILGGYMSEVELSAALDPVATQATPANIDVEGAGHDDLYITPTARDFTAHTHVQLYRRPDRHAAEAGTLLPGQRVRICGQAGDYVAIVVPSQTALVFALASSVAAHAGT